MQILIEHNGEILKKIQLTRLQGKALKLMSDNPVKLLADSIDRILEYNMSQAKQKFAQYRLDKATDKELETIADEIQESVNQ